MIDTLLQVLNNVTNPWVPVYVLLVGFLLTGIARMVGRYVERNNYRQLFINNIRSLQTRLPLEIKNLERRVEALNPESGIRPFTPMPGIYQLSVFRDMTYRESFKAYFSGIENYFFWSADSSNEQEKLTEFNTMWGIVNALENYTLLMGDSVKERTVKREEANMAYRADLGNLQNAVSNYLRKYLDNHGRSEKQVQYYEEILSVMKNYYSQIPPKFTESNYTYKNLILPFQAINSRFYDGIDEDVVVLTKAVAVAEKSYKLFIDFLETEVAQTTGFLEALKQMNRQLSSIIEKLS